MSNKYIQPMLSGEIISRSFRLFQENIAALIFVTLVPQGVLLMADFFLEQYELEPPLTLIIVLVLTVLMNGIALSAITVTVAGGVLGGAPNLRQAYGLTLKNQLGGVIIAYFITSMVTSFGLLLFVIPGLLLGGLFAPTIPIIVIEGKGATEAITRSIAMMRQELAKGVAVFAFVILVSGILPMAIQLAVGIGPFTPVLGALAGAICLPLAYTANVLLYFSVRSAEGYSEEQLDEDLNKRIGR